MSTLAGSVTAGSVNGTGTAATFNNPWGIATNSAGTTLFVADHDNQLIRMITSGGAVTTLAGSGSSGVTNGTGTSASFDFPFGVAVDGAGNVYVAEDYDVRVITPAGVVSTLASSLNYVQGIAVNSAGSTVYGADSGNNRICAITSGGVVSTFASGFNNPEGVAVDASGNVYVADSNNNMIRKITSGGVVSTIAGSAGVTGSTNATGTNASFNCPRGIAVNSAGTTIFVADDNNNLIRMIVSGNVVSTLAGSGTPSSINGRGTSASFAYPQGIAVDASGIVYVADGNEIRKLQ